MALFIPKSKCFIMASIIIAIFVTLFSSFLRFYSSAGMLPISFEFIIGIFFIAIFLAMACYFITHLLQRYFGIIEFVSHLIACLLTAILLQKLTGGWNTIEGFLFSITIVIVIDFSSLLLTRKLNKRDKMR